ncbi:hypothetical protein FNV43_RR02897 [Rhamnella rubrinervis]|uniref:Seipin n=1 Tax=Rhamnella rubrinervis TaxID=2594499 RepID=A0A8K0MNI7_9ROSA|nr:hypothetical protein FNV43_RR02897 [Rhamnella rubrinervis]
MVSESYHRAEEVANTVESTVQKVPSSIIHGCFLLLKKLGFGFLGAAYVCMVLIAVFIMAVAVGVALVQLWVEEPVSVRERLYFDYTHPHPDALFSFGVIGEGQSSKRIRQMGIPVGQTISVSLALLMPESGFNRDIGVFQLSAEIISVNGDVISKSSHPCILRYRSPPVRLARTALISIPLLLGITDETQRITIQILKHKEGFPRTSAIRVILIPRAGTSFLPQLYEAEILINSKLPWTKGLIYSWKWTFYVWSSINIYFVILIFLILCCKPLFFPMMTPYFSDQTETFQEMAIEPPREPETRVEEVDEEEIAELLRKWRQSRSKRKAIYLHQQMAPETVGSSASTISISREETSTAGAEEDFGDSESVCLGG